MCTSLQTRCDEVNKEYKELREDANKKKLEFDFVIKENECLKDLNKTLEDQMGELEGLKESNKKIIYEMEELYALTNIKRKRVLNGEGNQDNLSNNTYYYYYYY